MSATAFRPLLLAAVFLANEAGAAVITYDATRFTVDTWRDDYTVGAITSKIALFDVLLDPEISADTSLVFAADPALTARWDQAPLATGIGLPALAMGRGSGMKFTWLGTEAFGAQAFEVYNAQTIAYLGAGPTMLVPAPAALLLMAAGVIAAGAKARW